jgi:SAM-dependent methyltransferase
MAPDGYLMEDVREAGRLAAKVDARAWVARYLEPHLADGMRVLDAGCGPAVIAAEVARRFPGVDIVALDASEPRLAVARDTLAAYANASVVAGDVHRLPFPDESFDLVYSRFLFEYLAATQAAADELLRVCRPGGTVLLQDLDVQLVNHYPPDPELDRGIAEALALLEPTGFDPHVGRKLRHLLEHAGLVDARVTVEPYHLIVGAIEPRERALWKTKLEIAATAVGRLGPADPDRLVERFLDYLDRHDTLTFSNLFTVHCRRADSSTVGAGNDAAEPPS